MYYGSGTVDIIRPLLHMQQRTNAAGAGRTLRVHSLDGWQHLT